MSSVGMISIVLGFFISIGNLFKRIYRLVIEHETGKMNPIDTQKITEEIFAVKDRFVNMYLIKNGDKYIAVDSSNKQKIVKSEMDKLNINPDNVVAVFLTHSDYDHIGSIGLFKNADVYISSAEQQMINGKKARGAIIIKNKLRCSYKTLEDNQIVNILGYKIQGIMTPGHTPGSMSFLVNDEYLFTGDILSLNNGKVESFNKILNMDSASVKSSIKKLASFTDVKYVFTSHYGYTNDIKNAFMDFNY